MTPMEALGMLGYALDTPGALTRGVLSGRPGERASGREMFESWGLLGSNPEGLDAGDVAGFAADLVVDPLNLIGLGAVTKAAKGAKGAKAFNTKAAKLLETGGMPEDVAKLTKAVDEAGNPLRLYHGTPHAFGKYDAAKLDKQALYGPGVYTTTSPEIASGYADTKAGIYRDWELKKPPSEIRPHIKKYLEQLPEPYNKEAIEQFSHASDKELAGWMPVLDQMIIDHNLPKEIVTEVANYPGWIEKAPNVRMHFMDARRPFDMNATYAPDEVNRIAQVAGDTKWNDTTYPMIGEEVFGSRGGGVVGSPTKVANQAGYDAITHTGGQLSRGKLHDVWIATDPAQVYSPWIAPNPVPVPSIAKPLAAVAAVNAVKQLSPPKPPRTLTDYQRLTSLAARSTR